MYRPKSVWYDVTIGTPIFRATHCPRRPPTNSVAQWTTSGAKRRAVSKALIQAGAITRISGYFGNAQLAGARSTSGRVPPKTSAPAGYLGATTPTFHPRASSPRTDTSVTTETPLTWGG